MMGSVFAISPSAALQFVRRISISPTMPSYPSRKGWSTGIMILCKESSGFSPEKRTGIEVFMMDV
jgi:hypothetical protein